MGNEFLVTLSDPSEIQEGEEEVKIMQQNALLNKLNLWLMIGMS